MAELLLAWSPSVVSQSVAGSHHIFLSFAHLLQVGRHANVLQALSVARRTDGARGLFRGTIPLLSREVPFYVVGMTGYAYLKKVFDGEASETDHSSERPRHSAGHLCWAALVFSHQRTFMSSLCCSNV